MHPDVEGAVATSEKAPLLAPPADSSTSDLISKWQLLRKKRAARRRIVAPIIIGAILAVSLFFPTKLPSKHKGDSKKSNLCVTPECIHASSEILYNLSPQYKSLDPCSEDLEELICGGWRERHDLRPDQGDAFTGTTMAESSQLLLRHILEAPYPKDSFHSYFSPASLGGLSKSSDEENFDKMKAAYDACLDVDSIAKLGLQPLTDIVQKVKELYPVQKGDDLAIKNVALQKTISELSEIGVSTLIGAYTGADDKDPDSVIVSISPPYRIGLPAKERYEDDKIVKKYTEVLGEVLPKFYSDAGIETSEIELLVEFEKKLAAASPSSEDRQDVTKTYNPFSIEDAAALCPEIELEKIIDSAKSDKVKVDWGLVTDPNYVKQLRSILSETSDNTLQLYFIWKTVQAYAGYVESDDLLPYKRFAKELAGQDPDSKPDRWRTCIGHVDDGLGWILSRFFVEKAFSAKAKVFGDQIVSDIKDQFAEKLKKTEWMDDSVKELAVHKVYNIVQKIGYPTKSPDIMDPPTLQKYYDTVTVNGSSYFGNALSMSRHDVREMWETLGKPVDRARWDMTVPTVNAYYNPPGNEIVFPAGIMQFPVFDVNVPPYLSYGAFGSVAGHELSHAFDSTGRHYDENGNYTDWWTKSTVKAFEKRAQCFINQYGNFTIDGPDDKPLHVNGKLTLGENIADAGGVAASFAAWKKRSEKKPNQDIPGLEHFTQDQLFFVSYGTWWCGRSTKAAAINRIYSDPHAPKWARILGTMANSRDFKDSFNCPQKEPVCELW